MSVTIEIIKEGQWRIGPCPGCDGTGWDHNECTCPQCRGSKTASYEDRAGLGDVNWNEDNARVILNGTGILDLAGNESSWGRIPRRDFHRVRSGIADMRLRMGEICEVENASREADIRPRLWICPMDSDGVERRLRALEEILNLAEGFDCDVHYY